MAVRRKARCMSENFHNQRRLRYYPNVNRDDAAITETESLLKRVYKGSVSMMMNTLIHSSNLSDSEIKELYLI